MIIVTAMMMMKSSKASLKKNKRLKICRTHLMMRSTAFDKKETGKIPGLFICSRDWLF